MGERQGRVLAELAELGMTMARGLAARAQGASSDEAVLGLALAFHRVSRAVRMTLALESRLAQERREAVREDRVLANRACEIRKGQVRTALWREISHDYERDEALALLREVDAHLAEEVLFEDFGAMPLEACIAQVRKDLDLEAARAANDEGADPTQGSGEAPEAGERASGAGP
ncbi:hypothetical protein [Phenylobacterium sp.]|uniref:hypothetical protein n=1 Tax=Phenylobacterium sp. TaxID=1871053 RepID=UPI0027331EB4|nr:hypothetical protein [Phenylobacterium sp.]MDP3660944.1 hypothetical protein [Phenylobacterium sp.]